MYSPKLFTLLIIFILPLLIFSQTWKSTIDLNITVEHEDKTDLYTNKDGNHVIVQTSSQLKYYLFSYAGSQIRTVTIDNSISAYPRLSCVNGYLGNVYVIWKEGSVIRGKRTTNAGQNWTTLDNISLSDAYCNGLEVWPEQARLHAVWSESEDETGPYETYHRSINHASTQWGSQKQVTDLSGEEGGFPSVTTSTNRIHVAYTVCDAISPANSDGPAWNRDKYYNNWQTPILIFDDIGSQYTDAARSDVIATSDKLHAFYYDWVYGEDQYHWDLDHKSRNFSDTTWGSITEIQTGADVDWAPIDMAVTKNDSLHIAFDGYRYREFTGSWEDTYEFTGNTQSADQKISANSNDIYITWIEPVSLDHTIKLRQRDYPPLAPQNLSVTESENSHPYLSWDENNEADLDEYKIYKKIGDGEWDSLTVTNNTYYEDTLETVLTGTHANETYAYYKLKAKDKFGKLSDYSDTENIKIRGEDPEKVSFVSRDGNLLLNNIRLYDSYPNPFNPSTTIEFDLPQSSEVTLKVFNILGEEVATLVSDRLSTGSYSYEWDASNLASGIYFYKLEAEGYIETRKMILMK